MEVIAHLFRALANASRIKILRLLAVLDEQPVLALANTLDVPINTVSGHLGKLASTGLVWRRRSGRTVYYRLAEHPASPVVRAALRFLSGVFRAVTVCEPRAVALAGQDHSPTHSDASLFALFTAFTHPRRLQILKHLSGHDAAEAMVLSEALSMSVNAAHRHLAKLEDRGLLIRTRSVGSTMHQLAIDGSRDAADLVHTVIDELTRHTPVAHTGSGGY